MLKLVFLVLTVVSVRGCYWNTPCQYQLFGSKTPYDTIRGDIRDYPSPANCEAVSVWALVRHGNRNPGTSVTTGMQDIVILKDKIIASYEAGTSELCAQDIDYFKQWKWNSTLETSQSFLTGTGYEELYNIGQRIQQKYRYLLKGTSDEFYFRPTNEQRTVTSCSAFVHGLTDAVDLNVTIDAPLLGYDFIRPYASCDRYQQDVKEGPVLAKELDKYFASPEYIVIQNDVQKRLGIDVKLDGPTILSIYEMCRFYRSWSPIKQSPWCSIFTERELMFLEYYDDVRHYYRNGYGSWVNERLGHIPLKDMYENFMSVIEHGSGRKVVSYFTHDTMMEMAFCAMGLFKDTTPLHALSVNPDRLWRTSYIAAFATNIITVLNRCKESGNETFRVQVFINEKETPVCPVLGCTLEEFQNKFQTFSSTNLDFCSMDYVRENEVANNSATTAKAFWSW